LEEFIDYHEIVIGNVVLSIELDYLNQNVNDYVNVLDLWMIDYFQNDYDF
jgi:hypothetical protein